MDFFGKLNMKNTYGIINHNKNNNIVNIICGILLIILIIVIIVCLCSNKSDEFTDSNNCDVFMFDREGCGFSAKMKKIIQDNNNMIGDLKVCIINMIKEPELAKKYNVNGTPTFALKNDPSTISSGLASIDDHYKKLKKINNEKLDSNYKKHRLISRDNCPFCQKALKLLDELNIDYEKIDSNSSEGINLMNNGNDKNGVNGVPYMITNQGKEIIGFKEDEYKKLN